MAPRVNPYIAGNPVGGSPAFIGRETILRSVLRMLESPTENAIVLYGQRRIGKTSVLQELARRLPVDGPYHPVYFDLQDKAALPLAQVLTELAQQLAAQLQLSPPDNWQADAPQAFRTAFIPTILDQLPPDHSLVLLFDEFDVLDNPTENQAGTAFFPYLRELLTISPRLQFVFVIGRRPEDLSSLTLSVFKGVRAERISQLDAVETERLVRLSEVDGSLSWSNEAVQRVRELTGGHPFLTQQLCQEVWERAYQDAPKAPTTVMAEDVEQAVPDTLRGATSALEWLWNGLGPAERVVASALASAGPRAITQEELETRLQESGVRILVGELRDAPRTLQDWDLIEPDGDGYRFRVELLRRWIAERKPLSRVQEEIDRIQPAAETMFQAAYSLYQAGQLDESQQALEQVVRLNPNHQRGNLLLAEILLARNQLAEARQLLEDLYRHNPVIARPRLIQTLLLQARGGVSEKMQFELYGRVLDMEPNQLDALAGQRRVWKQRGDRALRAGKFQKALAAYREGDEPDKVIDASLLWLTELQHAEQYTEALALIRQLWSDYPQHRQRLPDLDTLERKTHLPELHNHALAAMKERRTDEAVQILTEIVSLEPGYREATRYLHLAVTGEDVATLRIRLDQEMQARQIAGRQTAEESQRRQQLEKNLAAAKGTENQVQLKVSPAPRVRTPRPASREISPAPQGAGRQSAEQSPHQVETPAPSLLSISVVPIESARPELSPSVQTAEHRAAVQTQRQESPPRVAHPRLPEKPATQQPPLQLTPWSPLDLLRLLGWLFVAPGKLKAYKKQRGDEALQQIGKWLAAILIWLPLFIPCLALGLGVLPRSEKASSAAVCLGLCVATAIAFLITGWLGDRDEDWISAVASIVAFEIAFAVAFALAIGVMSGVTNGTANVVAFALAFSVAIGMAAAAAGIIANIVAFSGAFGAMFGVAFSLAGAVAVGVALNVVAVVAFGVVGAVVVGVAVVASLAVESSRVQFLILLGLPISIAGIAIGLATSSFVSGLIGGVAVMIMVGGGIGGGIGVGGGVQAAIEKGRPSLLTVGGLITLVLAEAFLVWLSFLGGWQVFA